MPKINNEKLDSLISTNYHNRKRGVAQGLTQSNMYSASFQRAEKLVSQNQLSNEKKAESLMAQSLRDPYSGLKKVFIMPASSPDETIRRT